MLSARKPSKRLPGPSPFAWLGKPMSSSKKSSSNTGPETPFRGPPAGNRAGARAWATFPV